MTIGQYQRHLAEFSNGNLGASATLDFHANGVYQSGVLNSATCTLTFSAPRVHATIWIELIQDATGGRAVTFPGTVVGTVPAINTAANGSTLFALIYNGTNYQFAAIPSAVTPVSQAAWYVNASTGNDANAGTVGAPIASLDELRRRLNPGGTTLQVTQSTAINVAAGTYPELILSISIPVGSNYTFDILSAYTSGSSITLSSVTDTVPSATPTRGNVQTASGAFADKARIRSTSGVNAGAVTYCTGLNGGATNAWVKSWFSESSFTSVNIANGTTCVVDTLQVTINRVQIRCSGHPLGGQIRIFDAILPNGAELTNAIGGSASLTISQCRIGSAAVSRLSGNLQLHNCQFSGAAAVVFFGLPLPVLAGCVIENSAIAASDTQIFTGNCVNGGSLTVGGQTTTTRQASLSLADTEWVNGSGTALTIAPGSMVQIAGQQYGFGSSYAVGYSLSGNATVVTDTVAHASGIIATQPITMAGQNVAYSDLPRALVEAECFFTLTTDATARVAITSAFGRVGRTLVAATNDYAASQVTNDSTVTGTGVAAALNTLKTSITALVTGVSSVYGRAGAVVAVAGDYAASKINNDSATVTGTHVSDALDALKALIAASVTGVSSVYGRTGAVVAATNDYTDLQIQNTSSVAGTGVKGALNTLLASIGSLVTGVSSVYGRTGAVVAATNDYNSTQVTNSSGVTGTGVTGALNTLDTEITNLNRQYASVVTTGLSTATLGLTNEKGLFLVSGTAGSPTAFTVPNQSTVAWHIGSQIDFIALNADNFTISGAAGVTIRTPVGNLAATNSLYHLISIDINLWELTRVPVDSTHLTNTSGVSGATVTDALNTLNAKTSSDITNASTVVGTTITDALQTLQAETPGVVGVSVPIIPMLGTSGWSGGINDCYMGTGASGSIGVAIPLYPNLALSSVDVRIEPNTGHGSVPSGLPIVQAWVSKAGAHVGAGLAASVSDTGHATVADYELEHSMTIVFGTPLTPAGAQSCWLRIVDENALPGLRLRFVKATYS